MIKYRVRYFARNERKYAFMRMNAFTWWSA